MKVNNPEVNQKGTRLRKHKSALGRSCRKEALRRATPDARERIYHATRASFLLANYEICCIQVAMNYPRDFSEVCAISSVVERLLHTQEVAGSNPASRTRFLPRRQMLPRISARARISIIVPQ